ncbi:MAG: hypothetical protein WCJ30_13505, partial [Deltaproteobacteria bacterium]
VPDGQWSLRSKFLSPTGAHQWPSPSAMAYVNDHLGLIDRGSQNWEIVLADAALVEPCCDLYERENLDTETRFAVMALLVASMNERARRRDKAGWVRVRRLLTRDFAIHGHTVRYWSVLDATTPVEQQAISSRMRSVWRRSLVPLDLRA